MRERYNADPDFAASEIARRAEARDGRTPDQRASDLAYAREKNRSYGYTEAKRAADARRRAAKRSAVTEAFSHREVFDRDGWRCGICRRKVNADLTYPHPKSASLDHVVPLSKGGDHTRANTRLAHLSCNVIRKDRGEPEQLALVG